MIKCNLLLSCGDFFMNDLGQLSKYSQADVEKINLIEGVLESYPLRLHSLRSNIEQKFMECNEFDVVEDYCLNAPYVEAPLTKYCPKCGEKYPDSENVCLDCLVHLKNLSDKIDVSDIKTSPKFKFDGKNSYDDLNGLLSADNLLKIKEFDIDYNDYLGILHGIKAQAFKNFDETVKENEIDFDSLDILDKIVLFAKSFVKVEYKSYGGQLGYFENGMIIVDDRQTKSLQITTIIHELSHFLIKEMLVHVLCKILDARKNEVIDDLITFILSYSPFTQLIDEYSAHNVEGRFTMFGFQDYSSYYQIEKSLNGEMPEEEIEITKTIGNTFAISIKEILESLIDRPLREDIKDQFLKDVLDSPNYAALKMETCQLLNEEGFITAIWLILNEGCEVASAKLNN